MYRVLINYCVFSLKFWNYSELCQGKPEKGKSLEYLKIFEKNTIFNEHPVSISSFENKVQKVLKDLSILQ